MIKKVITEEWETTDHKRFPIDKEREALQHEIEYLNSCISISIAANTAFETCSDEPINLCEYSRGRYLGGHQ